MPQTPILFYRERDGRVPVLEWLRSIPVKPMRKCVVRMERLSELGWEMTRDDDADTLRDGIHELRARFQSVNYRLLYFFHSGNAIITHGCTKEDIVPPREIDRSIGWRSVYESDPVTHGLIPPEELAAAIERKRRFELDPDAHVHNRE